MLCDQIISAFPPRMSLTVRLKHHPPNLFRSFFEWQLHTSKPQWYAGSRSELTPLHTVIHDARKTSILMVSLQISFRWRFSNLSRGLQVPPHSAPCHNVANADQCSPGREDQLCYNCNGEQHPNVLNRGGASELLVVSSNIRRRMLNREIKRYETAVCEQCCFEYSLWCFL